MSVEQMLRVYDGPGSAVEPRAEDGASSPNDGKRAVPPGALLSIAPPSALPSASQLDRVMPATGGCLGSAALPQIRSTSIAARTGTFVHRFLQEALTETAAVTLTRWRLDPLIPEEILAVVEHIDPDTLPWEHFHQMFAEVAYALDVDTGEVRLLGVGLPIKEIQAARRPSEIVAIIDLEAFDTVTREVYVYDYKTGSYWTDPWNSWQLRLGALCSMKYHDGTRANASMLHLRGHNAYTRTATWDMFDLEDAAAQLYTMAAAVRAMRAGIRPLKLVTGPHCGFCPAIASCPAKTAHAQALAHPERIAGDGLLLADLMAGLRNKSLDPETARLVYERLSAYDIVAKEVWAGLEEYASTHPFPVGNGKVLAVVEGAPRDAVVSAEAVHGILVTELGAAFADAAAPVTRETSVGAIEKAASAAWKASHDGKARGASDFVRGVKDKLRATGAVRKTRGPLAAREIKPEDAGG